MTSLRKYLLLGILFLFALSNSNLAGQKVFQMSTDAAQNITASSYVPSMNAAIYFSGSSLFFYPISQTEVQEIEWLTLSPLENVTAAVNFGDDELLVFNGTSFLRLQPSSGTTLSDWEVWGGLPSHWGTTLTAAATWSESQIFLFNGNEYVVYDFDQQTYTDKGDIREWPGYPQSWLSPIDASLYLNDGHVYFINDGEIAPYSFQDQSFYQPLLLSNTQRTLSNSNSLQSTSKKVLPTSQEVSQPEPTPIQEEMGCVTGRPAGSKLAEIRSQMVGKEEGRSIEDQFPSGRRIAQIKVYSSKLWGKTVICGLQILLKDDSGTKKPMKVFGKTSSNVKSFELEEDECIAGIAGSTGGNAGDVINHIQIHTTFKSSPIIGNRAAPGSSPFSIMIPDGGIFNGFYGTMTQNISSIGMKYYGKRQQAISQVQPTQVVANNNQPIDNTTSSNKQYQAKQSTMTAEKAMQLGIGVPPTMIEGGLTGENQPNQTVNNEGYVVVDEYIDDYDDFTSELGNMAEFMVQPLTGIDWLGAGFDILYYDPLNPNELNNRKSARTVLITNSPARAGNKNQYLRPFGSLFGSANSGSVVDSSTWVTSYQQFTNSFSIGLGGSVKVPKAGGGSMSSSYRQMNSTSLGSESIYMFTRTKRKIHEVELQLTWIDNLTGQKYKQKLDRMFQNEVANLPVPKNSVKRIEITKKNQILPNELGVLKGRYFNFIKKYGTHMASKVAFGGQYISRTMIKRSQFEKARMTEFDFKAKASATIKKVKVGGSVDFGISDGEKSGRSNQAFIRDVFVQGGNGETDQNKWGDKVDQNMAPIEIEFIPLSEVLDPRIFSKDPDIEKKQVILATMIEKYIMDNYREGVQSKNDFFRELPDLPVPGNVMVKNSGGYVMWFTVKYELDGKWETKESGNFTLGFTESIEIPVGARNITVKAEQTTGEIFTKEYEKPEIVCFKCSGTIFETFFEECSK